MTARMGRTELLALVSAIMAFMAVGVDVMLPAFDDIRDAYDLDPASGATARIVTFYFFGVAFGQLLFGPIADRFGRKRTLLIGTVIYLAGVAMSVLSPTFGMLLGGRVLWGIGAAAARVVATAVVRDRFDGEQMASALSQVMAVFVLVPVFAPSLGALILAFGSWQLVFWSCAVFALAVLVWSVRLVETLNPADRRPLRPGLVASGYLQVARTPVTFGYTVASIFLQAAFTGYLASAELLTAEVFDRAAQFPVIFGAVAALFGVAALLNGRVVGRIGLEAVLTRGMVVLGVMATALLAVTLAAQGRPNFWLFMPLLGLTLATFVFLMPNLNAAAMQPLGAIAGSGSALTGAARMALGAVIGGFIAERVSTSLTPLAVGIALMAAAAAGTILLTRQGGVRALRAQAAA